MLKKVQKTGYLIFILAFLVGSICLPEKKALAASAAINLSLSVDEVTVDSTFSVVLTVEASEGIKDVICFLEFDSNYLKFQKGGAFITQGDGMILISDKDSEEDATSKKYSMKFKALQEGETTLFVTNNPEVTCFLDDTEMSVSRNQLGFEIVNPAEKSNNASLSLLTVSPGKLIPEFKAGIHAYKVEVEDSIEKLEVNAEASEKGASVSVKGNQSLKAGENTIKITVAAPSGDKSVTNIKVIKKEAIPEEKVEDAEEAIGKTGVSAKEDKTGNRFLTEQVRIQITEPEETTEIPTDYIKTTVVMDGIPITVYAWKYDLNSDKLLVHGTNQDGESGFYIYNRENNSLEKYRGEQLEASETNKNMGKHEEEQGKYTEKLVQMGTIVGITGMACALLTIALVFQVMKNRQKKNEKEDDFF